MPVKKKRRRAGVESNGQGGKVEPEVGEVATTTDYAKLRSMTFREWGEQRGLNYRFMGDLVQHYGLTWYRHRFIPSGKCLTEASAAFLEKLLAIKPDDPALAESDPTRNALLDTSVEADLN